MICDLLALRPISHITKKTLSYLHSTKIEQMTKTMVIFKRGAIFLCCILCDSIPPQTSVQRLARTRNVTTCCLSYVGLFGLAPNGDIGSHSLSQIYTFLNSSKTNDCTINVRIEVQNMNHIKRGQYPSLKPQKRVILDVYTGHRRLIQLRYLQVSFSEQSCHQDQSLNNMSYMYKGAINLGYFN